MNETKSLSPPAWFWIVSAVALLWNIMGCGIFLSEMFAQEAMMESMTEEQKEWVRSTPGWLYVVFAISVATGLTGSILLLMKKKLSVPLFAVSFVAVVIQMGYTMLIAGGLQVMGPSGAIMPVVVTILALIWLVFSFLFQNKGWLS